MKEKEKEHREQKVPLEILKKLRLQRAKSIQRAKELLKEQRQKISAIESALKDGPKTVPEISELTAILTPEVLWWVASLKKYGVVMEHEKRGSYFAYKLAQDEKKGEE